MDVWSKSEVSWRVCANCGKCFLLPLYTRTLVLSWKYCSMKRLHFQVLFVARCEYITKFRLMWWRKHCVQLLESVMERIEPCFPSFLLAIMGMWQQELRQPSWTLRWGCLLRRAHHQEGKSPTLWTAVHPMTTSGLLFVGIQLLPILCKPLALSNCLFLLLLSTAMCSWT